MAALLLLATLLMISGGVSAFNVMGYANVQYTILYYQYRDLSFQTYPFMGHPLETDWISLPLISSFTNGFFSGIFWNLLEINATQNILKMANDLMLPLAPVANLTSTHDVGFVIMSSFGHAYRLFKLPDYLNIMITAANSLSTRYSPIVRCTRSWNSKEGFLVIIDNMMNLELLFETSKQTNNQTWYNIAWQHANRTMYEHFRPDNSTYHVVEYNEADGSVIRKYTAQGKRKNFKSFYDCVYL
jgi:unsaturated chondroitin disaccharide hydrolase